MHATFKGVVIGSVCSMLVLLASKALAGTGVGSIFNLGRTNTVNHTTVLKGASAGSQLQISNTSAGQSGLSVSALGSKGLGLAIAGGGTGIAAGGDNLGGSFASKNVGLTAFGANDGVEASATAANKSGAWAHHDGSAFGYGLFAQSANGPAIGMSGPDTTPPITLNGAPFPSVTAGFKNRYDIPNDNKVRPVAQLDIGPGTYMIWGKTMLTDYNGSLVSTDTWVSCTFTAGGDSDDFTDDIHNDQESSTETFAIFHTFTSAGQATLSCRAFGDPNGILWNTKIFALRVAGGTNTAMP